MKKEGFCWIALLKFSIAITFGEGRALPLVFVFYVVLALCMICACCSLDSLLFYGYFEGGILLDCCCFVEFILEFFSC